MGESKSPSRRDRYTFKETVLNDVHSLKHRLRESDKDEIAAGSGRNPSDALMDSFERSGLCWTAFENGKSIAMFGAAAASLLSTTASPWMLGSEELNRAGIEIVKVSRYYVHQMKRRFPDLVNYIDARQTRSIRWLKWLGFHVEQAEPWGVARLPFHKFWM